KKSCVSQRKKSTVPALSKKRGARSKLSPPNSAAPRRRGDLFQNFSYTISIEWIRKDDSHDRSKHIPPDSHHSRRAGADSRGVLGRRAIRSSPAHQRRSLASRRRKRCEVHRATRCCADRR